MVTRTLLIVLLVLLIVLLAIPLGMGMAMGMCPNSHTSTCPSLLLLVSPFERPPRHSSF